VLPLRVEKRGDSQFMKQNDRYCGTLCSLVLQPLRLILVWQYSPGYGAAGDLGKIPNIGQFRGLKWQLKRVVFS
jgi:hypothetical protein